MGKLNKQCFVCGEKYSYCYSCPSDLQNPTWRTLFDTENCKNIFNILCRHGQGKITDEETRNLLNECDLTYVDKFNESLKNHFDKVFSSTVKEETIVTKEITENIVGEPMVEEVRVPKRNKKMIPKSKTAKFEATE